MICVYVFRVSSPHKLHVLIMVPTKWACPPSSVAFVRHAATVRTQVHMALSFRCLHRLSQPLENLPPSIDFTFPLVLSFVQEPEKAMYSEENSAVKTRASVNFPTHPSYQRRAIVLRPRPWTICSRWTAQNGYTPIRDEFERTKPEAVHVDPRRPRRFLPAMDTRKVDR